MAPLPKGGCLRSRLGDIVGAIHESPDRAHRSIPPPSNDGPPPFRLGRQEKASPCVGKLSPKVTDEGSWLSLWESCHEVTEREASSPQVTSSTAVRRSPFPIKGKAEPNTRQATPATL